MFIAWWMNTIFMRMTRDYHIYSEFFKNRMKKFSTMHGAVPITRMKHRDMHEYHPISTVLKFRFLQFLFQPKSLCLPKLIEANDFPISGCTIFFVLTCIENYPMNRALFK